MNAIAAAAGHRAVNRKLTAFAVVPCLVPGNYVAAQSTQPLSVVPASMYVVTTLGIHCSGATTPREALRLAPHLQIVCGQVRWQF